MLLHWPKSPWAPILQNMPSIIRAMLISTSCQSVQYHIEIELGQLCWYFAMLSITGWALKLPIPLPCTNPSLNPLAWHATFSINFLDRQSGIIFAGNFKLSSSITQRPGARMITLILGSKTAVIMDTYRSFTAIYIASAPPEFYRREPQEGNIVHSSVITCAKSADEQVISASFWNQFKMQQNMPRRAV